MPEQKAGWARFWGHGGFWRGLLALLYLGVYEAAFVGKAKGRETS